VSIRRAIASARVSKTTCFSSSSGSAPSQRKGPPTGTKWGVTRYEAWRLPAIAGEPGFVSVALVADMDAKGDLMDQVDKNIMRWSDERSGDRGHRRRRF
jgi:hypothetical protein